jgi:GDP-L-fucose synthase
MKIFVAGGCGFIGRPLTSSLMTAGHEVTATFFHRYDPVPGVGYKMADHTDEWFNDYVAGHEVVYICAGVTGGAGAIKLDPMSFVTPNLLIHLNLFEACKRFGVKRVVVLSSTTGYPNSSDEMKEEDYFNGEPHPAYFNPAHTRRFIERMGAMHGLDIVWIRPSVVYGHGDSFDLEKCHVIPALVRKVAERHNPLTVWGLGTDIRSAVYIDDMVEALVMAATCPAGAYNISGPDAMSVNDMLATLISLQPDYSPVIDYDLTKPSMIPVRLLNIDRARDVMGWTPKTMMRDGLKKTLDWYRNARQ